MTDFLTLMFLLYVMKSVCSLYNSADFDGMTPAFFEILRVEHSLDKFSLSEQSGLSTVLAILS